MLLPLVFYPNPLLRKKTKRVTVFDDTLKELAKNMAQTMFESNGVGLAAPQIGVDLQIFVADPEPTPEMKSLTVFINPTITSIDKETSIDTEGCLSIPGLYALVKRHNHILVKAFDVNGKPFELEASDFFARIIQHEYDHLMGVLFTDKVLTREKKDVEEFLEQLRKNNA